MKLFQYDVHDYQHRDILHQRTNLISLDQHSNHIIMNMLLKMFD